MAIAGAVKDDGALLGNDCDVDDDVSDGLPLNGAGEKWCKGKNGAC
jgi:hypothetical protein